MGVKLGSRKSKPRRCAKKVLLLVEGASEETYFRYFRGRSPDLRVIPVETKRSSLAQMLEECQYRVKDYEIEGVKDKVAVVFDVDCFTAEDIEISSDRAIEQGIDLYASNPSFEFWLILHFKEYNKYVTQKEMGDELSVLLGRRYSKSEGIMSILNEQKIKDAIIRASKIIPFDKADPVTCKDHSPSTTVHSLVNEILEAINEKNLR
ncbi:MAG: RloB family protein [Methanomassiliicoccaceae archaeon]|nr:RloB family protein [Methanomassiliicoccaceae archaeon]